MTPEHLASLYLKALTDDPSAWHDWSTNDLWTPRATRGLRKAGQELFPGSEAATRGHPDSQGQSEYLNLDVCLWDPDNPWGPPLFIAETESKPLAHAVEFSAWKLLVVEAQVRVLVAYFGDANEFDTREDLRAAVQRVCQASPGRPLILISAGAEDASSNEEIIKLHGNPITCTG